MFGPLADDRHSLLLAAGILLAAAYVSGGAAVGDGLQAALTEQADRFPEGPRLAFAGDDPWTAPPLEAATPAAAARLELAEVPSADGNASWTVATVRDAGAGLTFGDAGAGRAVRSANVTLAGDIRVEGRIASPWFPHGWLLVDAATFANLTASSGTSGTGHALLLPPDVTAAPAGLTVLPLGALPSFVRAGGESVTTGFVLLVAASSLVAVVLSASLAAGAVRAHRHDLHLLRSLGASRAALRAALARWMLRVVALGLVAGASLGIVAAYAVFSFGNRLDVRAPVVPTPEPWRLALALAALGAAALVAGVVAGARGAAELEGQRLEANS